MSATAAASGRPSPAEAAGADDPGGAGSPVSVRPAWVPGELYPFASRRLDLDGARLHYVDEGEGAPLVLLHGNPTWSFLYRRLIPRLRGQFRCLALDLPGFGLSEAPPGFDYTPEEHTRLVDRWMSRLGVRDGVLMVHDWGGPIGLCAAAREPERFRGFVLANSFAWPLQGTLRFELFSRFWGGAAGRLLVRRANAFVNWLLPLATRRTGLSAREMQAYRGPFPDPDSRRPTHVFPRELLGSRKFLSRVEAGLGRVNDRPALLVWGGRDPAFRRGERERFEAAFPEHRTVVLEEAGHFVQEEAPEEAAAAVLEWWEGVRPAGGGP